MQPKVNVYKEYVSVFNPKNGYMIRKPLKGFGLPEWCPEGPELMDVHITDYCPLHCEYCYRESDSSKSNHMAVDDFRDILLAAAPHVHQVAIGGGSPQHHPQFDQILKAARDLGVVPSYTTNGIDMDEAILRVTKEYVGAVAVSIHGNRDLAIKTIKKLHDREISIGVHLVLDKDSIDSWTEELEMASERKGMLGGDLPLYSCVCLMHKPVGRGNKEQHPSTEQKQNFIKAVKHYRGIVPLGVDSCLVTSLTSLTGNPDTLPRHHLSFCDSGCFSLFVGEDLAVSPCSFNKEDVYSLNDHSLDTIWKEKLQGYREKIWNACPDCESRRFCRDCHALPEINPCTKKERTI